MAAKPHNPVKIQTSALGSNIIAFDCTQLLRRRLLSAVSSANLARKVAQNLKARRAV